MDDAKSLIAKYRLLTQRAHDPDLTLEQKIDLLEEAEYLKGYVCHLRRYSDITVLQDGEYVEDYFACVPIGPTVDTEGLPSRRARIVRKEDIKKQLLAYYKYNNRMFKTKLRLFKQLHELLILLARGFGQYGKKAVFRTKESSCSYETFRRLQLTYDCFLKEFGYIITTKKMRSMYGSYIPSNFGGRHRIIVISEDSMDWIYSEPELEKLREYLTSDGSVLDSAWCAQGIVTPHCLETVLRLSLRATKFTVKHHHPERTEVHYGYTDTMKQYLNLSGKSIENLRVRTIVTKMIDSPKTVLQETMLYGKYTEDQATSFLNEMESIQHYADMAYET